MADIYGTDGDDIIDEFEAPVGESPATEDTDYIYGFSGNDTLSGGGGDDFIYGGDGDDLMYGGDGYDYIEAGYGNDLLDGGAGYYEDTAIFDFVSEATGITFTFTAGNSTISTPLGIKTLVGIERVEIYGSLFDDVLTGGSGWDSIVGALGNDILNGGDGFDFTYLTFYDEIAGVTQDFSSDGSFQTSHGIKTLISIEGVAVDGSQFGDTLIGGIGENFFFGNAGNDTLIGGGGFDHLYGGGFDYLYGDDGIDTVIYNGNVAGYEITITDPVNGVYEIQDIDPSDGDDDLDYLFGIETIIFADHTIGVVSNHAPFITSNGGGAAAAVMIGENGTAVATVAADDADGDAVVYSISGGADAALFGIDGTTGALAFLAAPDFEAPADAGGDNVYDVIVSASDGALSDSQTLSISVSDLVEGNPGVTITGTELNDTINTKRALPGQSKATVLDDLIFGLGGDDNIDGGAGVDQMHGGLGNDTFTIDNASDQVIELANEGIDTMKSSVVDLTLADHIEKGTVLDLLGVGADLGITGNDLANTLTGNRGANMLAGGEGKDVLNGKDGNDILAGDAGDDKLNGGNGDDVLSGGAGIDFLTGGAGSDTLTGGSEADQFKFDKLMLADGLLATDTIADFSGLFGDGDRISLSAIDANGNTLDGNQKFAFIGMGAFSGTAGQLRYEQSGGDTWLSGDINGDMLADFQIIATGLHNFAAADFIL